MLTQTKRTRVSVACDRCKRRKKRCEGLDPCENCKLADARCSYSRALRTHVRGTRAKESEVDEQTPEKGLVEDSGITCERQPTSPPNSTKHSPNAESAHSDENEVLAEALQNRIQLLKKQFSLLQEELAALRPHTARSEKCSSDFYKSIRLLLHDTQDETYAGSTAIVSKVNSIKNWILSKLYREVKDSHSFTKPPPDHAKMMRILDSRASGAVPVTPTEELEAMFVQYFNRLMGQRYFFYEPEELEQLFAAHFGDSESLCPKFTSRAHQDAIASLILGTGCRLVMMSKQMNFLDPKLYFDRAMDLLSSIECALNSLDQIRLIMHISLYLLVSYDHNVKFTMNIWELSGLAIRKITQTGLHRFNIPAVETAKEYETKKRIFWSVYTFEKVLCMTLGRPASISEDEIDVPYPLNIDSLAEIDAKDLYKLQIEQQRLQYHQHDHRITYPQKISRTYYLIQMCRVRELELRIGNLEQSIAVPLAASMIDTAPHIESQFSARYQKIETELESWRAQLPTESEFLNGLRREIPFEYLTLCYHRSKMFLCLTRLMHNVDKDHESFHALLVEISEAAGGVCKAYMAITKDPAFGYGMFSLHSVFLVGIILAYSILNLDHELLVTAQMWKFHNYLRHCSVLLSLFAERTKKAASFRILFDRLLEEGIFRTAAGSPVMPATPASFFSQTFESGNLELRNLMDIFSSNTENHWDISDEDEFWEILDSNRSLHK
ncbi:hypothetical protein KL930_005242 [Ogataea haglerorum]|nr:hypothetical protein KL914_005292 [Ogataea haglerorum]KAG7702411.1 hypothetical protein KL950_005226 [Ogataea haglerorum]KAG7733412.1 hypothetical protein KL932_005193 [Ogataea haglerorum]KAG7735906.1 hypothetical protein KL923_005186 [Ogataea haglerorum]KAG7753713.1 hypothetical protein KL947_005245 [Ogataea haglerorum]